MQRRALSKGHLRKAGLNPDDGMLDGAMPSSHLLIISPRLHVGTGCFGRFHPTDLDAHYAGGARGFKMNF